MISYRKLSGVATTLALGMSLTACQGDFLSGGELSNDPNRPTVATNAQLFVGIQSNIFYFPNGDLTRMSNVFVQYFNGVERYAPYDQYLITEGTTNGAQRLLYGPGGLGDARILLAATKKVADSLFTGIVQVQEAMLMGFNADAFGDVVYTQALGGPNPALDPQLAVYDSIQVLLSTAIDNMAATGPTNVGPQSSDLVYGGDAVLWTQLAHTLKARYYMHTAEVRGTAAYTSALAETFDGIPTASDNYTGIYSGDPGEANPWSVVAGPSSRGLLEVNAGFDQLLVTRGDPRRTNYFRITGANAVGLSTARVSKTYAQPIATDIENDLIQAEAAFRIGGSSNITTAQNALLRARTKSGRTGPLTGYLTLPTGTTLLSEILTEKYIANFQLGLEGWKDYRRTCFPNLPNRSEGGTLPMPGRFYYDAVERLTNTSIPMPGTGSNGIRNEADPENGTAEVVGGSCLAGA